MKTLYKIIPFLCLLAVTFVFYHQFFMWGKIPIPADTIVGMYHPWKDSVWGKFISGVPFKNPLITDPVRQQFVWRLMSIDAFKKGYMPVWNPYSFSGTPLLANFQSAAFYPLNILFFLISFETAWSMTIILQTILGASFMYLYLREKAITRTGSLVGSIIFAFSGFSIAWLEWNTIGHTALWLPLSLYCIDKIIKFLETYGNKFKFTRNLISWITVFCFSVVFSFMSGHLQTFFYCQIIIFCYLIYSIFRIRNRIKPIIVFVLSYLLVIGVTSFQWLPTLKFISLSARDIDQAAQAEGFFLPWQHLLQFIAPDFFGNPTTGNYWGVWNYGEFVGYIGILPIFLVCVNLIINKKREKYFWLLLISLALLFSLPTPLAKLPYLLHLPFISTSQPTRLIFMIDFCLVQLAASGFDHLHKIKKKSIFYISASVLLIFITIWGFIFGAFNANAIIGVMNLNTAKRNFILPTSMFSLSVILLFLSHSSKKIVRNISKYMMVFLIVSDLFRFGWKFNPFAEKSWLYPATPIIDSIKQDKDLYRVMSVDRRILPPNFSDKLAFQDVSGYDPLYLLSYNRFVSSWDRNKPDITPSSYNRIVTPQNYEHFFTDLLGVKYVLSLTDLKSDKLQKIFQYGETRIYQNIHAFPRAFFINDVIPVNDDQDQIDLMYKLTSNLRNKAVTSEHVKFNRQENNKPGVLSIVNYKDDSVIINSDSDTEEFMVLSDIFYPAWKVYIDGIKAPLYRVDFLLRGIEVPEGKHEIVFKAELL